MSAMIDDLNASLNEAIEKTVEPLKAQREKIAVALDENSKERRDLESQMERVDRMIDAAKLRKKAGRPARSARQEEPVAA